MACRLGCNNSAAWYQHPVYAPYWKHYELMIQWMEQRQYHEMKEREVVDREMQYKSSRCCRCWQNTVLTPASSSFINSTRRRNAPRNFESARSRRTKRQSGSKFHNENNVHRNSRGRNRPSVPKRIEDHEDPEDVIENSEKEPDEDSEYECLISDEFISFMKQSEAFRRERDAEKKKKKENVDVEYIDLASVTVDGLPQIGQPNVGAAAEAKRQLMEQWYGKKNAPVITGMETAMRCSFNWLKIHQQPVMWPNIPIKIKFD